MELETGFGILCDNVSYHDAFYFSFIGVNMSGKFLSPKDLSAAKYEQEVWNSMLKRGLIDPSKFVRTHYVVCGCGAEGCGFITTWLKTYPNVVDLEQQKFLYEKWLEMHSELSN